MEVVASKEILLPIKPMDDLLASSFQFELELPEGFELVNARIPGLEEPIYMSQNERIAIIGWYSALGVPVEFKPNLPMLILTLKAPNDPIMLNKSLQMPFLGRSEVANVLGEPMAVRLSLPNLSQKSTSLGKGFALYPNPVQLGNALYLQIPSSISGEVIIDLRDALGRLVASFPKSISVGQTTVNLSEIVDNLSTGSYTLSLFQSGMNINDPINLPFIVKF
jgi:hypothetical protein